MNTRVDHGINILTGLLVQGSHSLGLIQCICCRIQTIEFDNTGTELVYSLSPGLDINHSVLNSRSDFLNPAFDSISIFCFRPVCTLESQSQQLLHIRLEQV